MSKQCCACTGTSLKFSYMTLNFKCVLIQTLPRRDMKGVTAPHHLEATTPRNHGASPTYRGASVNPKPTHNRPCRTGGPGRDFPRHTPGLPPLVAPTPTLCPRCEGEGRCSWLAAHGVPFKAQHAGRRHPLCQQARVTSLASAPALPRQAL